jgi:cytidylate kinase
MGKNVMKRYVVTLDGPAGAGKSTVSKELSKALSYIYLDTGALYRAVAYQVIHEIVSVEESDILNEFCRNLRIRIQGVDSSMRVLVGEVDVTDKLRTEEVGILASSVSALPVVREVLYPVQREAGRNGGIVAEGRDMGTVVFPDADYKFFLDASVEERVNRRYKELSERGLHVSYDDVKRDLVKRDKQDTEREISPLMPSSDAIIIDCTKMTVADVVKQMLSIINHP